VTADSEAAAAAALAATAVSALALAALAGVAILAAVEAIAVSAAPAGLPTRQAAPVVVDMAAAITDGTGPEAVVGMVVKAAHAHMMTDLEEASETATPDSLAATWSLSGRAARMVGTPAAEITIGLKTTTTHGNAATRVVAMSPTPEGFDATDKTLRCLVVGITLFPCHCSRLPDSSPSRQ
jgi:hypothetical protein